ncbi:MAG: MFS transporter [Acidobacteriota bacterium]|nr:MFS transporter [Acidobacteriota bacterium]
MSRWDSFKRLSTLMVTAFVDMMGFAIIFPLLPFYAEKLGADAFKVGALVSVFFLAQLLSAPLWGKLSDRFGRRPVILSGLVVAAVAFVVFELADAVWLLFLSRFIQGAGGGKTGVLQAYVSDMSLKENRAEALGWLSAATSAGVMIGPVIGSATSANELFRPGFIAAGLCLVSLVFTWIWLPESFRPAPTVEPSDAVPEAGPEIGPPQGPVVWGLVAQVMRHPKTGIGPMVWIYASGMMAFMAMNAILVLYLEHRFEITEKTVGFFFFYVASVSLVMRAFLLGPLVRRFGEVRVLKMGALCVTVGLLAIPTARSIGELALAVVLIPAGTALLFPATTSLVSARAPAGSTGTVLGVHQGFGGVARMTGPLWSGAAYQSLGTRAPFWMAAVLMAAATVFSLSVSNDRRGEGDA